MVKYRLLKELHEINKVEAGEQHHARYLGLLRALFHSYNHGVTHFLLNGLRLNDGKMFHMIHKFIFNGTVTDLFL